MVLQGKVINNSIELNKLTNGIYNLLLIDNELIHMEKIVKLR